jgi:hypothetical protein
MSASPEPAAPPAEDLEAAADQAIAACGGDAREAVKALLVAVDFIEARTAELRASVSTGYSRDRYTDTRCSAIARSICDGRHLPRCPALRCLRRLHCRRRSGGVLSANAAVMRAEALSRKPGCAGAVAFSRSGDPATGEFGDAKLLRKFGDVPDDLSAL